MSVVKTILLFCCVSFSSMINAQSSPSPMLEQSANQIIAVLKANKSSLKANHKIIYDAVATYFLPHVDVMGMSRSVLGRQVWQKANAAQRAEFAKVFTQLVIRTYASPLAEYSDETVQFLPIRGSLDSRFLRVNSVIVRSSGQNIPLSYSLVAKNGTWNVYDLSVEGVSLLQSFRSQFAQVLKNSDIDEVIKQMQQKQANKAA